MSNEIITEDAIDKLIASKRIDHILIIARFTYKYGQPIMNDEVYGKLEARFKQLYPNSFYSTHTYDEDPYPSDLIKLYNLNVEGLASDSYEDNDEIKRLMDEEQSKSIRPVENYEEAWEWFKDKSGLALIFSTKVDGINTKNLYKKTDIPNLYEYLGSRTRGRTGESMDITANVSRKLPSKLRFYDCDDEYVWVRAEAFGKPDKLQSLRDKYNVPNGYVTPRSTGISLLRVKEKDDEDLDCLRLTVFKTSAKGNTAKSIKEAEINGLDTVPYKIWNDCPNNFEEFKVWLKDKLDYMWQMAKKHNLPTDGVVVEVDDQSIFYNMGEKNQYFGGNIALKMNQWQPGVYVSKLKEIEVVQKGYRFSFVGIIEPTRVQNGNTVSRVNLFNLAIIQDLGLVPGSELRFQYKSESAVDLIY